MHDDESQHDLHRRKPAIGRSRLLAVALAGGVLMLAACGGSSGVQVAGSGSSSKTALSSKGSRANLLAYAACMRSHGLPDFPDPDSSGGFPMPSDIDPSSAKYQAAASACKVYAGPGLNLTPARQEQIEAHALEFAQCMRSHGVPGYPDPVIKFSNGGVTQAQDLQGTGVDPKSPVFQAAQKACQSLSAGSGNGG